MVLALNSIATAATTLCHHRTHPTHASRVHRRSLRVYTSRSHHHSAPAVAAVWKEGRVYRGDHCGLGRLSSLHPEMQLDRCTTAVCDSRRHSSHSPIHIIKSMSKCCECSIPCCRPVVEEDRMCSSGTTAVSKRAAVAQSTTSGAGTRQLYSSVLSLQVPVTQPRTRIF